MFCFSYTTASVYISFVRQGKTLRFVSEFLHNSLKILVKNTIFNVFT